MHCPVLISAESQRADGLTVRGNGGKINEGSDRKERGGGEGVGRDRDRKAEWLKEYAGHILAGWDTASEKKGACSTWEAAASLGWEGESHTGSHIRTHVDKLPRCRSGGGREAENLIRRWEALPPPVTLGFRLSTCSGTRSIQAIKESGANRERASEIMLVAESSFPIFGNCRSCRGCGFTDSGKASWSCSKTRSPHSKVIYLSRDEGRICRQDLIGVSSRCCHSVERTCNQSSDSHCTADVKVTTTVQLSAVKPIEVSGSGSGHWMTSVADEGHLDPFAETSQGRSSQELWCLCKQYLSVSIKAHLFCLPMHVCTEHITISSVTPQHGVSMARFCIAWQWWEAECCCCCCCCYQLWLSGSGQNSISPPSDPLGWCSWTRPVVRHDLMT